MLAVFRSPSVAMYLAVHLCLLVLGVMADSVSAKEPQIVQEEIREFRILVDGNNAGKYSLTLAAHDDGTETMTGDSEVSLSYFNLIKYHMKTQGFEVWRGGHLQRLNNEADFNGDKFVVQATATGQTLDYNVNGKRGQVSADIWVSSYWREPEAKQLGRVLPLFDADKGRELKAKLSKSGAEEIQVGTQMMPAAHYTLRGDVHVDLWYDERRRLIRQEDVDSGHKSRLELVRVTPSK